MKDHRPVALITGGARRVGRDMALALAKADYAIAIHYNHSKSDAEKLCAEINAVTYAASFQRDLSDQDSLASLPRQVAATFGRLDLLVNNASLFYPTTMDEVTATSIEKFHAIHVTAPTLLSIEAGAIFREQGTVGRIINIVDVHADYAFRRHTSYIISKAGLKAVTKQLAVELAPHALVNAIAPGAITEPEEGLSLEVKTKMLARIPLGRFGDPADITGALLFLAKADYITGHTLVVDGGRSLTI